MRAIMFKYLCHLTIGCHRKTLLPVYKLLSLSIIDYGPSIYGLAPPPSLSSSTQFRAHHCVYSQARSVQARHSAYAQKRHSPSPLPPIIIFSQTPLDIIPIPNTFLLQLAVSHPVPTVKPSNPIPPPIPPQRRIYALI